MDYQVIYFSSKGNTKKIADAIASELSVEAEDVKNATLNDTGMIFLGTGCYGSRPGKGMTTFIENNDFKSRNIALFGTSGSGIGKMLEVVENKLKEKEANIKGQFVCKGKFLFASRGRPNNDDIADAKQFANKMKK